MERSTRHVALAGLAATAAGLGAGQLVGALTAPSASPVTAVGSRVIEITPAPVKEWAISTFGTADKVVLVGGVVVVTLTLGVLTGVLGRRRRAAGLAVGGLLSLVALGAAWFAPVRAPLWPVPGLATFAVGALALTFLLNRTPAERTPPTEDAPASSRRRFLGLTAAVGGAGLATGALGTALGGTLGAIGRPAVTLPPGAAGPQPNAPTASEASGLSPFETPTSEFFRIDIELAPPTVDQATWRLNIDGLVDRPFSLGWDDLLALDAVTVPVTLECVSNDVGGPLIGSARWVGVRTADLLERAGVQAGADQVFSTSVDGFTVSTPLAALTDARQALVCYGMNGAPLPPEHGFPVRLLTPGLYGFVGATKWLTTMTVARYADPGSTAFWTKQGWSIHGEVKPSARIETPRENASVAAGDVKVGGSAWAHRVGVGLVQVRVDGGPWTDATLGPTIGVDYWRQWIFHWAATPGSHLLQARVVDARGIAQDEARAAPFPDGSSGLHTVSVTVR